MNEKEAIERVEKYIKSFNGNALDCVAIGTVLTLLENKDKETEYWKNGFERELESNRENIIEIIKKDKIIDLMAEELVKAHEWFYSEFDNYTKEDFIKYFENKVEEE